jgi:hypothetical protein
MCESGFTKSDRFLIIVYFSQRGGSYVSERVRVGLIVTTGKDLAGCGDYRSAPRPETAFREGFAVVMTVCALDVTAVFRVGRYQRVPVGVVVQLCGLEDQAICSEGFVFAGECRPFMLVRTETKGLKFDERGSPSRPPLKGEER